MTAPVTFSLGHVLDAVVDACVQELVAARRETAVVRAAAATERHVFEARIGELEEQLEQARLEGHGAAETVIALRRRVTELETATVHLSPPRIAVKKGEALDLTDPPIQPAPARIATEAERAAPPQNPRLSGFSTLAGLTFGTWFVLERGASGGSGATYWKCRCIKCGATRELAAVGAFSLRRKPPGCSACVAAKRAKARPPVERDEAADDDQEDEAE